MSGGGDRNSVTTGDGAAWPLLNGLRDFQARDDAGNADVKETKIVGPAFVEDRTRPIHFAGECTASLLCAARPQVSHNYVVLLV
jgi:hypothetical protein